MGYLKYLRSLSVAIVLTSSAYFLGDYFLTSGLAIWHSLLIGASVVIIGAVIEKLHSPMWLIILAPFPIGMSLLFLFLEVSVSSWFITYIVTLFIYVLIHIVVSSVFRFHSLIPAWKLSAKS